MKGKLGEKRGTAPGISFRSYDGAEVRNFIATLQPGSSVRKRVKKPIVGGLVEGEM